MRPIFQEIKEGNDAEFTCLSSDMVSWLFNEGQLPRNAFIVNNSTLLIKKVKGNNQGVYMCKRTDMSTNKLLGRGRLTVLCKLNAKVFSLVL